MGIRNRNNPFKYVKEPGHMKAAVTDILKRIHQVYTEAGGSADLLAAEQKTRSQQMLRQDIEERCKEKHWVYDELGLGSNARVQEAALPARCTLPAKLPPLGPGPTRIVTSTATPPGSQRKEEGRAPPSSTKPEAYIRYHGALTGFDWNDASAVALPDWLLQAPGKERLKLAREWIKCSKVFPYDFSPYTKGHPRNGSDSSGFTWEYAHVGFQIHVRRASSTHKHKHTHTHTHTQTHTHTTHTHTHTHTHTTTRTRTRTVPREKRRVGGLLLDIRTSCQPQA